MAYERQPAYQPGRENLPPREPRPAKRPDREIVTLSGVTAQAQEKSGDARREEQKKLPLNIPEVRLLIDIGELPDETIKDPIARKAAQEKRRKVNARPLEEDFIFDPEKNPTGIYTPEQVAESKRKIESFQARSEDQLATFRGINLEHVYRENIESNDWGGDNVFISQTTLFDDMRNYTDYTESWKRPEKPAAKCGVDVTTSESDRNIEHKLARVEEDLISGRMSKLDYFIDMSDLHVERIDGKNEFVGKKVGYVERFPRVIIALGHENSQALTNNQMLMTPEEMGKNVGQIHYLEQHRDQFYWGIEVCLKTILDTINARYNEVVTGADAQADERLKWELQELLAEAAKLRYDETKTVELMKNFRQMDLYQKLKTIRRAGNRRPNIKYARPEDKHGRPDDYGKVDLNEQLENIDTIMEVLGIVNQVLHEKTYPDPNAKGSLGLTSAQIDEPRRQKNIVRRIVRNYMQDFDIPEALKDRLKLAA